MAFKVSKNRDGRRGEAGYVLFIVLLLIIMFTGFGILAMRHTRAELRSSGSYLDATQAGDLVEGALALVATDLRSSSDYYQYQFLSSDVAALSDAGPDDGVYQIPLNVDLFIGSECNDIAHPGCIAYLSTSTTSPTTTGLYRGDAAGMADLYGVDVMTTVTHKEPEVGPCPPGFSCFDDQNYGWYTFTVDATASYGSPGKSASNLFELGRAVGKGRMTVGPVGVFGK
jgi:hypothetical protein